MEINLSENKHRFIELLRAKVQREGVNKLIAWLEYAVPFGGRRWIMPAQPERL